MTIITSNFIVNGTISNFPALYTNNMTAPGLSNITINSDLSIKGDVFTNGRMDMGNTIFAKFRLNSNIPFQNTNEVAAKSNHISMDMTSSDMSAMNSNNIPMVIPSYQVYNGSTGVITVPTSGFYSLEMQGSFSNDINVSNPMNGVYFKFLNHSYSNARTVANIQNGSLVSTNTTCFLLAGDQFKPCFYSSDSNATVLSVNGESYVGFTVLATVTPTHSNYVRV